MNIDKLISEHFMDGQEGQYSTSMSDCYRMMKTIYGVWDISSFATEWYVKLSVKISPVSDKVVISSHTSLPMAICMSVLKIKNITEL